MHNCKQNVLVCVGRDKERDGERENERQTVACVVCCLSVISWCGSCAKSRSRNVNASTRAHNWSTTLDGRRPINN